MADPVLLRLIADSTIREVAKAAAKQGTSLTAQGSNLLALFNAMATALAASPEVPLAQANLVDTSAALERAATRYMRGKPTPPDKALLMDFSNDLAEALVVAITPIVTYLLTAENGSALLLENGDRLRLE